MGHRYIDQGMYQRNLKHEACEEIKSNGVSRHEVGPKRKENSEWLMREEVVHKTNEVILVRLKMRQSSI